MSQVASPCDCCFTSIAVTVLIGQGSWLLVKSSAREGWLTCKTGWHDTGKVVRHICNVTLDVFEYIGQVVAGALRGIGYLFSHVQTRNNESCFCNG